MTNPDIFLNQLIDEGALAGASNAHHRDHHVSSATSHR
jgi:hypothetical protein